MCPNCGAAARTSDVQCGYCKAQLQTVACPSCLGMIFRGAKHCSHCGAKTFAVDGDVGVGGGAHRCPRCSATLTVTAIGSAFLEECSACGGVWVDAQSFQQICQSREQQSAYVGAGSPVAAPSLGAAARHESASRSHLFEWPPQRRRRAAANVCGDALRAPPPIRREFARNLYGVPDTARCT